MSHAGVTASLAPPWRENLGSSKSLSPRASFLLSPGLTSAKTSLSRSSLPTPICSDSPCFPLRRPPSPVEEPRRASAVARVASVELDPALSDPVPEVLDVTLVPLEITLEESYPRGLEMNKDGTATFKVWAPHAQQLELLVRGVDQEGMPSGPVQSFQMDRVGDYWGGKLPEGVLKHGMAYQVRLLSEDGRQLLRRDPYARSADPQSCWCFVDDHSTFKWKNQEWSPPAFEEYIIYEMHVGSFTPGGTFISAIEKLEHVAKLNFTAVQLMPIADFSCLWGYSQRQPLALHRPYGTPEEFRKFVDKAHEFGLAVIVDIVLHHGSPDGNMLWNYDGWGPDNNGGIYHEGGPDTPWGRSWAFWKEEVCAMVEDVCFRMLLDYRVDGLRFDSANDLPPHLIQRITWNLKSNCPGRILTAEITPEDPRGIHELGFDSLWVHSGYFDIIQQHRALGRGHHGGGDWAEGWNLPRMKQALTLHYGFEKPSQCVKYILGSHDQVGCQNGGGHHEDYKMIGGQHRYAVDQFCGGRTDSFAVAAARLWYTAGIAAAGLPMMFMGTEWAQPGWWHVDEHRRPQWDMAEDDIGKSMMALVGSANALRAEYPVLRVGWPNILHEDRPNGVMACERVAEGEPRIVAVVNAGRGYWQSSEYGVWVGGGVFEQVFNSQDVKFGGSDEWKSNEGTLTSHDGKLWINIPPQCTLLFQQTE